jgi:Rps23 Pro-64 3,4-dihydroxylase Tpa1-like proline 4-hydroxylase
MAPVKLNYDPRSLHDAYVSADPFPHAVIDGLFDDADLDRVLERFPTPDETRWMTFDSPTEKKLGFFHEYSTIAPEVRAFLDAMNGFEMLLFLEAMTGIEGLIPDPYFGGGGLHQIERDGFLKIHADFNLHPKLKLDRRVNLLIYLNRDWQDEWGGHLELWNREMTECRQLVAPLFNRSVVFSTGDTSWHGHPKPLRTPAGVTRKSVSLYYYTAPRSSSEFRDTIFREPGSLR